jgi:hypothetical protein
MEYVAPMGLEDFVFLNYKDVAPTELEILANYKLL